MLGAVVTIGCGRYWIPACAGMTIKSRACPVAATFMLVIPAQAGGAFQQPKGWSSSHSNVG
jgi:hypothetical protein